MLLKFPIDRSSQFALLFTEKPFQFDFSTAQSSYFKSSQEICEKLQEIFVNFRENDRLAIDLKATLVEDITYGEKVKNRQPQLSMKNGNTWNRTLFFFLS